MRRDLLVREEPQQHAIPRVPTEAGGIPGHLLSLQQSAGNRAVAQLVADRMSVQRKGDCGCGCDGAGSCGGEKEKDEAETPVQTLAVQRACVANGKGGKKWQYEYDGCSLPAKIGAAGGGGTSIDLGMGGRGAGGALTWSPFAGMRPGQGLGPYLRGIGGLTERGGLTGLLGFGGNLGNTELGGYGGYSQKLGGMGGLGLSHQLGPARAAAAFEASQKEGFGARAGLTFGNDRLRAGIEGRASERGGYSAMAGLSFTFGGFGGGPTKPTHPKVHDLDESRPRGSKNDPIEPNIDIPNANAVPGATSTATALAGGAKDNPAAKANPAGAPDTAFALGKATALGGVACDRHDECYQTCNSSREECDHRMYRDMMDICDKTKAGGEVKTACFQYADLYYKGLKALGGPAHQQRQDQVCGCTGTKKTIAGPYPPLSLLSGKATDARRYPTWEEYVHLTSTREFTVFKKIVNKSQYEAYLRGVQPTL